MGQRPDPCSSEEHYQRGHLGLLFKQPEVERRYQDEVLEGTKWFYRGAWFLVPVLGAVFGLLDGVMFGDDAGLVRIVRAGVLLVGLLVVAASYQPRLRRLFVYSSALFIVLVGGFSGFLVTLDDPGSFSPYFAGLYLAFAGIYTTPGLGLRGSVVALVLTSAGVLGYVGLMVPLSIKPLLGYLFFTPSVVLVFVYSAWIVENFSRARFATTARLEASLAEVRTLSGLLPICASCKKIRDDEGYWSQIESFISARSEATFSHGICPSCAHDLYPDIFDEPEEQGAEG